jgi:hypothetical protein
MQLRNDASIASAVVQLASAFDDAPVQGRVAACVLSRIPGDGAPRLVRAVAETLGLETVVLRLSGIGEDLPALAPVAERMDTAMATGRPVLILLDEAHSAPPLVLAPIAAMAAAHEWDQPCLILAISTSAGERDVARQLAQGMRTGEDEIAMHRTADENLRLVHRLIRKLQ